MRLVSSVYALALLGCSVGPPVDAPSGPPVLPAPSPLSQALQGMGQTEAWGPAELPPNPLAAREGTPSAIVVAPACAAAESAREALRAELRELRLTLGGEASLQMEATGAEMIACNRDPSCLGDVKARIAKAEAYDRAKVWLQSETARLAQAEVGLYEADRRVIAACGAP